MTVDDYRKNTEPLVSVLLPTYNRRNFFSVALSSVVQQNYNNLEILVIRDGGEDVSDIIDSFNDPRIVFINRAQNRGIPFTLNQGLAKATGKYICYLGNDDLFYPHHVSTLVDALEDQTHCQVAYSDLYRTCCRIGPDGKREVLSKVIDISRDFDRFFTLCYNHTLHVSLMHRRDLLGKIGPYNENLNVLIDWDLTRRLAFFTDFYHVHEVTGEYYCPVGDNDRVSIQRRKDAGEYIRNVMAIRTTRLPKPWPNVKDLSIIYLIGRPGKEDSETLSSLWQHTFYPYQVYLPLPEDEFGKLKTDVPNIINVAVDYSSSESERIDAALSGCEGEYVAIVPAKFPVRDFWVEDSLYALLNSPGDKQAFELEDSTDDLWAIVLSKNDLAFARKNFSHLPLRQSLKAADITIRRILAEEIPFQYDQLLEKARNAEKDGNWRKAAFIFKYIAEHYQNELWIKALAAKAFFKAGLHTQAVELIHYVNQKQPTVDTLLLEAKFDREKNDFKSAIELLEKAEQILEFPLSQIEMKIPAFKEEI